jgi:hypothetical protein
MKKALVTLAVGEKYLRNFRDHCMANWDAYAKRHGYDLVLLPEPIDRSARAQSRSVAWQKCLILTLPGLAAYDRVVWIDSDIVINPSSPDVGADVPEDRIGATDEYSTPSRDVHRSILSDLYASWRRAGASFVENLDPADFHHAFGLPEKMPAAVQTGVLVLSPRHHADLLRYVYDNYEDKGGSDWNYEMRPLSYEIQRRGLAHWIDPRFNMLWLMVESQHYPFLAEIDPSARERVLRRVTTLAWLNNYFLHFAASVQMMKYVDTAAKSRLALV